MYKFSVRFATPADASSIKNIADANKTALGFIPKAKIEEAVQQHRTLVLRTDHDLTGFVIFRHRKTDNQTTIYDICISEKWRGHNGGRILLEALINNCKDLGRSIIRLKCPTDLSANGFYETMGFKQIGVDGGKVRPLNVWQFNLSEVG